MATWATADLHACLNAWEKMKEIIGPDDKVYVLGDCIDRGSQPWETLKSVYSDPRVRLLKGNHEDMLIKACRDYIEDGEMWSYNSYTDCYYNGGYQTMMDWEIMPDREKWINYLNNLPVFDTYVNKNGITILLSHAGFSPWRDESNREQVYIPSNEKLIWDREHTYDDWDKDEMNDNVLIVHGHNPSQFIADFYGVDWVPGAFWYCNNHKICIDNGGVDSGYFCLLNLDTFDEEIIDLNKGNSFHSK